MNSSIHLCQSPLPVAPGRLSSATMFHVSLSHGSLISVPQSSKRGQLVSSPLHMNSRLHRFSEEREKKNSKVRGGRGASLEMACSFLGAFSVNGKMKHKPILACGDPPSSNSTKDSVKDWLNEVMTPNNQFFNDKPNGNKIEALKLYAMALSKDDPKEAEEKLSDDVPKEWHDGQFDGELLMALVELLVYQEKYEEASKKIEVLEQIVKRDDMGEKDSPFHSMAKKWKKFYLLKAIVESVNEAKRKESANEATQKPEEYPEDRWMTYCRQLKDAGNFPGPSRPSPPNNNNNA